jgi:hypothetical protein
MGKLHPEGQTQVVKKWLLQYRFPQSCNNYFISLLAACPITKSVNKQITESIKIFSHNFFHRTPSILLVRVARLLTKNSQFWFILEGLGMEKLCILYGHSIFHGHLVKIAVIWLLFPILVRWTKKKSGNPAFAHGFRTLHGTLLATTNSLCVRVFTCVVHATHLRN